MHYLIDPAASLVTAVATSNIHDTTCRFNAVTGWIEADTETLGQARARIEIDLRTVSAGDFLKTAKLKSDLQLDAYPTAVFEVSSAAGTPASATIEGTLTWRSHTKPLRATASGTLAPTALDARATFTIDMRDFGLKPPRVLMFKVEPLVAVEVRLSARPS